MTEEEGAVWALYRYEMISPCLDPATAPQTQTRAAYLAHLREHPTTGSYAPTPATFSLYHRIPEQAILPSERWTLPKKLIPLDRLWDNITSVKFLPTP